MHFPRLPFYCALAAVPMALTTTTSAQVLIDDFSTNQVVADVAVAPLTSASSVVGGMLGGEREMIVDLGTGSLGTTATAGSGVFNFANSPTSQGTARIDYDGTDGSLGVDADGLGGVDLTIGGGDAFAFSLLFADFEVDYLITVIDMSGNGSLFLGTLPTGIFGGGDEVEIISSFAGFDGDPVDFSDIGFISLEFMAQEPAADILIDDFRTVPEPTSIALLLAGGALLARRRRRD